MRPQTPRSGEPGVVPLRDGATQHVRQHARTSGQTGPTYAVERLHDDVRLQVAFAELHRCGPRPCAYFVAELLDLLGADPAALDEVLTWRTLDPEVFALIAGQFPRILHEVPHE